MISTGRELSPTEIQILESSPFADPAQKRLPFMKANEFDQKFDDGEDITQYLDLSQAKRSRSAQTTVKIDLPIWIVESIDREASRLGVTPQSIIQTSLTEHLAIHSL
jgi:CopG antitoxin of type II toxin-antitoxin system